MFCEKCGNKMNEGEKFCEKCGTPVSPPVVNTVNAPAQEAVNNTAPQENTAVNNAVPQPVVTAPKPPRQPMSPKAKKAILFSSIGAGVVVITLIVIFAFVLPMLNRVKVQEFIKVDFDEDMLYEGHASATFSIDGTEIYDKYLNGGKSAAEKLDKYKNADDIGSFLSDLGSDLSGSSGVYTVLKNCDVSVEVKGASDNTEETKETEATEDEEYNRHEANTSASVSELKGDEVVVVKLTWDKDEDSINEIKRAEKAAGISFDTTDTTVEIKISDELEKDKLKLEKVQNVDILDYIAENNLAGTKGIKEGDLSFCIKDFEYEVGDYKLVFVAEDYGIGTVHALEKEETLDDYTSSYGSVDLLSEDSIDYLCTGDKVTVNVEAQHISGTNIFIKESSKTFEIKANEPLDTESAKNNIESIKVAFNKEIEDVMDVSNPVISNIYLLEKKNDSADYENKIVVVYKCNYNDIFMGKTTSVYTEYYFEDVYMDGDDLIYYNSGTAWDREESLKDLEKYSPNLNDNNYTKVKIS